VITTNNAAYAARLKTLRQHAMSVPDTTRHGAAKVIIETYDEVGYNYRLTDVQAAIGIEQVKRLDWIVERRRELAQQYTEALAGHAWLKTPYEPEWACSNYQSYAVTLTEKSPCSRNELMQRLLEQGIATRRGIMLAHREAAFCDHQSWSLLQSESASDNSLLLPIYPGLSETDMRDTINILKIEHYLTSIELTR